MNSTKSPLDAARVEALRTRIFHFGRLRLDAEMYRILRYEGFSRRDLDRALEQMVSMGEIAIDVATSGVVRVRGLERGV